MPGASRPLPRQLSLRYLKIEAKRRLAAGEFTALHDAQAAIAREHGQPNWTALRQLCRQPPQESPALLQLRWVIGRFREAAGPGWTAPGDTELRQHFDERFLTAIPPGKLVTECVRLFASLDEDFVITSQGRLGARARAGGLEIVATAAADPPCRLTGLQGYPVPAGIIDARMGVPSPPSTAGEVPAGVAEIAGDAFNGLGLPGLVLAGGGPGIPPWAVAMGWADLDRNEILDTSHRFPAYPVAMLVTATAVLRLIGSGRLRLDAPASEYLHALRLADSSVTVRELLSHTGGVDSPAEMITTGSVPDLLPLAGGFITCSGTRGIVRPSAGGYAVLGQLIADTTGMPYADAVASLVLNPMGMSGSSIPSSPAAVGPRAITGYTVTPEGGFAAMRARIATVPAGAGLWATAPDLVRLGTGWSSLLPPALAREALTPQARPERGGLQAGLGWLISPRGDTAAQAGAGPGATVSLVIRVRDNRTHVVLTSRQLPIDRIDDALLRAWTNPAR